ncbi:MAG TPA: amidohydrolase family protein [Pyrinomonadaceae bacterium]|nr:amidohydrolase family protein [Pyrinomonadaceae bacterium]
MANSFVIDADTHVFEPLEHFERYLPAAYKHRSPRVFRDQWGIIRVLMEGRLYPDPSITAYEAHEKLRGGARLSPHAHDHKHDHEHDHAHSPDEGEGGGLLEGVAMAMGRPGVTDAEARVRDLAAEGIDAQVILGSLCLAACTLRDPGFALAFCRACNDFVAEFCSADPERLKPTAVVPLQDARASVAELRRAVRELGAVGVTIPPSLPGRNLDHADFHPFYAEAQALGVPVSLHWGNGTYLPGAGTERFNRHFFNHAAGHPFEQMLALAALVCGGVLEQFPRLKFGFLESGCGWVPYWLWRLDEEYRGRSLEVPLMRDKPSEYVKRGNCFFSCAPNEPTIPAAAAAVGDDALLFSSDYPHADGLFPNSVRAVRERADIGEELKRKILGGNAARFYGLAGAAAAPARREA